MFARASYEDVLRWRYFRLLRLPVLLAKSAHLRNRQILRNHLRLCTRLRRLDEGMPRFRSIKLRWVSFQRWLRLLENHFCYQTVGLKTHVRGLAKASEVAAGSSITTNVYDN